jgi:dipeptidyl aminopeptidase/acylaminoacyl peptidase
VKRFVLVLVPLALVFSGCAVPVIKPPTYLSDKGAVFNGNIYSDVSGDAEYSWGITFQNGGGGTSSRTVTLTAGQPGAVSTPFTLLDPDTTYHLTLCAQDHQENPPRRVCSRPTDFHTPPAGGRSGIAFGGAGGTWVMDPDGANKTFLAAGSWASWSPDARRLVVQGSSNNQSVIIRMNSDGSDKVNLTPEDGTFTRPMWSPDGRKIAFVAYHAGQGSAIWVMNADGSNKTLLAADNANEAQATWRPDGEQIAYTTDAGISVMNSDGSNQHNISTLAGDYESAWSPDGSKILFKHGGQLWTMKPDGSNRTVLSTLVNQDDWGSWSPDGTKIAFVSYRAGHFGPEVWKMDANGANPVALTNGVSFGFADFPAWSPRP